MLGLQKNGMNYSGYSIRFNLHTQSHKGATTAHLIQKGHREGGNRSCDTAVQETLTNIIMDCRWVDGNTLQ